MKIIKREFTFLILLLLVLTGCNRQANLPVYYGQFCNEGRTSFRDVAGLKDPPNIVVWRYPHPTISDEIYFLTLDAPTIAENVVYRGINAALNLDNGKEVWGNHYKDYSYPATVMGPYPYSGVVYGNKIFIVGGYPTEYLQAYNKDTGKLAWKSECIGNIETNTTSGRPLVINGRVYLAASSVKNYEEKRDAQAAIWVWNANSGKVVDKIFIEPVAELAVGKYRTLFPLTTMLAADGPDIYGITKFTNDSTYRNYIFCYETLTKKFTWFEPIEGFQEGYREMIAVDKDVIAISLVGDQWGGKEPQFFIKVFDKVSHKPLWENISKTNRELEPVLTISFLALHNGKLYAMTMDKRFVCFDWKIVEKGNSFVNIMPVDNGLLVTYQDNVYDMPQKPAISELWEGS